MAGIFMQFQTAAAPGAYPPVARARRMRWSRGNRKVFAHAAACAGQTMQPVNFCVVISATDMHRWFYLRFICANCGGQLPEKR
jgi:hypothetical protein